MSLAIIWIIIMILYIMFKIDSNHTKTMQAIEQVRVEQEFIRLMLIDIKKKEAKWFIG